MLEILNRITEGAGIPEDLDTLDSLAASIKDSSLCGLGQTCPNPVLSTIRYFRAEYEEHINDRYCRSGVCKALFNYRIDQQRCNGCTACSRVCPVEAIEGQKKEPHAIIQELCTRCGSCIEKCPQDCIMITPVGREADVSS